MHGVCVVCACVCVSAMTVPLPVAAEECESLISAVTDLIKCQVHYALDQGGDESVDRDTDEAEERKRRAQQEAAKHGE